jgi:hypothetical protein
MLALGVAAFACSGADESSEVLEGRLVVTTVMPEDFDAPCVSEHFIELADGRWIRIDGLKERWDHSGLDPAAHEAVHAASLPEGIDVGARVRVAGRATPDGHFFATKLDRVDVRAASEVAGEAVGSVESAVVAPTTRKVAVILANFSNARTQPITIEQARGYVFTNSNSSKAYFSEVSFGTRTLTGKTRPDGEVFGWYTIAATNTQCDYVTWGNQAREAARAAGVNLTGYDRIIHYFPRSSSCGWAGVANVRGQYSWINGSNAQTITHELGHNDGLSHASSLSCTSNGSRVSISSSCTSSEYGDPFDVMGRGYRHFNAFHKGRAGLFVASNTATASQDGTFTIAPIEVSTNAVQSLRVPIRGTSLFYYVEFRRSGGFDTFSSTASVTRGVLIHRAPAYTTLDRPQLIDTTPSTTSFDDAALQVGRTFVDATAGVSIRLDSIGADGARVTVDVP